MRPVESLAKLRDKSSQEEGSVGAKARWTTPGWQMQDEKKPVGPQLLQLLG